MKVKRRKGLKGSYTVEGAFVMAVTLWALVVLIQQAFIMHDKTKAAFVLQEVIEGYCHGDGWTIQEAQREGVKKAGRPLSGGEYKFWLKESRDLLGKKVQGNVGWRDWELDIESRIFDPEGFLRLLALAGQGRQKTP